LRRPAAINPDRRLADISHVYLKNLAIDWVKQKCPIDLVMIPGIVGNHGQRRLILPFGPPMITRSSVAHRHRRCGSRIGPDDRPSGPRGSALRPGYRNTPAAKQRAIVCDPRVQPRLKLLAHGCQSAKIPRMSITCGSPARCRGGRTQDYGRRAIAGTRHSQDALSSTSNKGGSLDSARPDCLSDAARDREELWIWGETHIMGSVTDEEDGNTSTNWGRIVRK
jgi:hypothetical protein